LNLNNELKTRLVFISLMILVILIFSFAIFGMAGARVFIGIILITMPFFLFLNNFDMAEGEKYVFSILLGVTIFPSLTYILGLLMSFRISMVITLITLILLVFVFKKFKIR